MTTAHRLPTLFASLTLTVLAGSLRAQYELRGQVELNQVATCYYCPPVASYVVHGTETPLSSSTVTLANYADQHVLMTGAWTSIGGLAVFDVATIQPTSSSFTINGNSSIGNTIRWTASGSNGDLAINIASLDAGVTPLSATTTLLLAPGSAVILDFGPIQGGTLRTDFAIPSVPSLVGLHMFGQALILPTNGQPFYFTEPDRKRVQ